MHKPLVTRTLIAALLGTAMLAANASGNATAAEATAMVKKGVAFIKAFSIPVRPLAVSHAAPVLLSESEAQETEAELVEAPSIVAPAAEQPAEPEPVPSSDLFDIETLTRT